MSRSDLTYTHSESYGAYLNNRTRPDAILPPVDFTEDGKIILVPGEVYCRWRGPDGGLCGRQFCNKGGLKRHYEDAHHTGVVSRRAGTLTVIEDQAVSAWYRDLVNGGMPSWRPARPSGQAEVPGNQEYPGHALLDTPPTSLSANPSIPPQDSLLPQSARSPSISGGLSQNTSLPQSTQPFLPPAMGSQSIPPQGPPMPQSARFPNSSGLSQNTSLPQGHQLSLAPVLATYSVQSTLSPQMGQRSSLTHTPNLPQEPRLSFAPVTTFYSIRGSLSPQLGQRCSLPQEPRLSPTPAVASQSPNVPLTLPKLETKIKEEEELEEEPCSPVRNARMIAPLTYLGTPDIHKMRLMCNVLPNYKCSFCTEKSRECPGVVFQSGCSIWR